MNDLIGNNYEPTKEQLKLKKLIKIVSIILALVILACIALIILMYYIQMSKLKVTIDGKENTTLQDILIIENEQVHIPIREFAKYVGYESYSGDYKQYEEDETKCYVKSANEITSFSMDSNKVYKLSNSDDYEYFTIDEPVKMINGNLYTTIEGIERAFNITFNYNKKQNQITIYTLPYLVSYWSNQFKNSAISGQNADFNNQKALLYNMIIVGNSENYYGVYDLTGKEIIGTKYTSIQFVEGTKEFIVTTAEGKMGIMSYDATTKISPEYDEIKQIDKDAGLYLVTNNEKQGVINNSGSVIVYLEYDQIGVDSSKYNNVINQYLLYDSYIPVKKDNKWGIIDKTGRQVVPVEYDGLGCTVGASVNQSISTNNVLLIPKYEGIVVSKNGLYGIIDSQGKELLPIALQSVYSTTSAGQETYYMIYQDKAINVVTYIENMVKQNNTNSNSENDTNNTNNVNETNNEAVDINTVN